MDRRMFDMSEFYRADSNMRSEPVRDDRSCVNNETDDKEYQGHDKTELQAEVGCFPKVRKFFHYNFPPYQP